MFYINLDIEKEGHLPLLSEEQKIFHLIRTYLRLPYSVAEYGCGKRTDIILGQLHDLGIESEALRYGMAIEPDMSAEALKEHNYTKRPHALKIHNPLVSLVDFKDDILLDKIRQLGATIDTTARTISLPPHYMGDYKLHIDEEVGFNLARSHIFPIVRFYDEETKSVRRRVLDPSLDREGLFDLPEIRQKLQCPEAVLFSSEIGGCFMLSEAELTQTQRKRLLPLLRGETLENMSRKKRWGIIRVFLNNAPPGSVGDPVTWTYSNNLPDEDLTYNKKPDVGDIWRRIRRRIQTWTRTGAVDKELAIRDNARWSEETLRPLTRLVNLIRIHTSGNVLREILASKEELISALWDEDRLNCLRGLRVRLGVRIDRMAEVSKNRSGEIDARTFTPGFTKANLELIRQMNAAGMIVFMDRVGNIHGILADSETIEAFKTGALSVREVVAKALAFHSHSDTVYNAGKYDGRLGVLSGVEIAHTLSDLKATSPAINEMLKSCPIMVSSYVNEEMTYTGEGVSMPGSAAVAGVATVEKIYRMKEPGGQSYKEGLAALVEELAEARKDEHIDFAHDLASGLDRFPDPQDFLPRQAIERHSEQAERLMKAGVPVAQVDAIMGIRQEDYTIQGRQAEQAALALIHRFHTLNEWQRFGDTRITNGSLQKPPGPLRRILPDWALHYVLKGQRNHAGSTAPSDRFDPGVAAGKLMEAFCQVLRDVNKDEELQLEAVIGDFNLYAKYNASQKTPAQGRNAIADTATISLGICGKGITPEIRNRITDCLKQKLNKISKRNGDSENKDLYGWHVEATDHINAAAIVVLSLDMRDGRLDVMKDFLQEKERIFGEIQTQYDVNIKTSVEQVLSPIELDQNGNVSLIFDGSIGGSHNPYEAERRRILLMGTIIQLDATLKYMENPDRKIFDVVQDILPQKWRKKIGRFNSGALHDTCQIAIGIARREKTATAIHMIG